MRWQKYDKSEKGRARLKKYKDKNRHKIRAQNKAQYRFKEIQICSIKGCKEKGIKHHPNYNKPFEIIWLCEKHHLMVHNRNKPICLINGCKNFNHAKGLCKKHYAQKYRKEQGW